MIRVAPAAAAALSMLCLAGSGSAAAGEPAGPVAETPHFRFLSDFTANLHDALIVAGKARSSGKSELFHEGEEGACFQELAISERVAWEQAVDYYAEVISPGNWGSRPQFVIRLHLAGAPGAREDEQVRRFTALADAFLAAAAPAYRACRWEAQDAENRRWVEVALPHLKAHGAAIAPLLERYFATPWHGLPLRVDVVQHAPPVGANTIIYSPAGGHVLISSGLEEARSLENMYHEAAHTLVAVWMPHPLPAAINAAAKAQQVKIPRDLWHVVQFYIVGEAVRDVLAEAGEPGYVPYMEAEGLWEGRWGTYREAVEEIGAAYMDGEITLEEAASTLVAAVGSP